MGQDREASDGPPARRTFRFRCFSPRSDERHEREEQGAGPHFTTTNHTNDRDNCPLSSYSCDSWFSLSSAALCGELLPSEDWWLVWRLGSTRPRGPDESLRGGESLFPPIIPPEPTGAPLEVFRLWRSGSAVTGGSQGDCRFRDRGELHAPLHFGSPRVAAGLRLDGKSLPEGQRRLVYDDDLALGLWVRPRSDDADHFGAFRMAPENLVHGGLFFFARPLRRPDARRRRLLVQSGKLPQKTGDTLSTTMISL